jgi:beta-apo-4'-carotenal oxygenase
MAEFYPDGAKASDYGRIVTEKQFHRLKGMIDSSKGKILIGGTMDEKEKFIEPTVVVVDDMYDSLIVDESFGPLIPILPVNDLDEAIRIAREVHSTPLGLYPFGTKKETDRILNELRSGGASVNDSYFHASIPTRLWRCRRFWTRRVSWESVL